MMGVAATLAQCAQVSAVLVGAHTDGEAVQPASVMSQRGVPGFRCAWMPGLSVGLESGL